MRELTVLEAVRESLAEEMERDSRVVLLGEDIGQLGGVFRATEGLLERFGPDRVVDTPMAELSIAGMAVGLAMRGLRPVAEIQFADFIHAAADHLIGEAARIRYRTAGDWTCPLVLRTACGCNASFGWDGICCHEQVRIDLDLGPLSPPRGDGTFTVVDYGPGPSLLGLPAVRPGQTAALRVGEVREGRAMLALSVDHRAVDGAEAGRFLAFVKHRLEGDA